MLCISARHIVKGDFNMKLCVEKHYAQLLSVIALLMTAVVLLTGCGSGGEGSVPSTPPPAEFKDVGQPILPTGLHALREGMDTEGYCSATGYYRPIMREEDSSYNICYTDFATGQEIIVCSQLNCKHEDESCTGWADAAVGRLLTIPVGDKVVLLYSGCPELYESRGETALARVEIMNQDGTDRQLVHSFSPSAVIPKLPKAGFARDDENVYFAIDNASVGVGTRKLYQFNINTRAVTPVLDLVEQEEQIVGAIGNELVLVYTPDSWDMSKKPEELTSQVIRFNPETKEITPIFEYNFANIGLCADNEFILWCTDHVIRRYDLLTGNLLQETPTECNVDPFAVRDLTYADGRLMISGEKDLGFPTDEELEELNKQEGPWFMFYFAMDVTTGQTTELHWFYNYMNADTYKPSRILAETETHYFVDYNSFDLNIHYQDNDGNTLPGWRTTYSYGFIPKEDFWNNTGVILPIIDATK